MERAERLECEAELDSAAAVRSRERARSPIAP
jgi:hypothetical protein